MLFSILHISWNVIGPIFLMMGLGWVVQKKIGLDVKSLTRLNFWIFVPALLFVQIVESRLSPRDMILLSVHFCLVFAAMGFLSWHAARMLGVSNRLQRALTSSVLFYNSGNYGIPAAQLAFAPNAAFAVTVQSIVIMFQNISNFSVGIGLHAGGRADSSWKKIARAIFSLPMIHTLALAWIWRGLSSQYGLSLPAPLDASLHILKEGTVPIALVTLGAQMGSLKSHRLDAPLMLALGLRLLVAPLLSWAVVWALGIKGPLAASLVISVSFPTAVNSALLAVEFNNEPDFAAATVFYSTLASALTVPLVIYAARTVYG
jgi:predicted permease